jgi:hypothetical protein
MNEDLGGLKEYRDDELAAPDAAAPVFPSGYPGLLSRWGTPSTAFIMLP